MAVVCNANTNWYVLCDVGAGKKANSFLCLTQYLLNFKKLICNYHPIRAILALAALVFRNRNLDV